MRWARAPRVGSRLVPCFLLSFLGGCTATAATPAKASEEAEACCQSHTEEAAKLEAPPLPAAPPARTPSARETALILRLNPITAALEVDVLGEDRAVKRRGVSLLEHIGTGERPAAVAFFATYCPPCIEEMPMFEALRREGHRVVSVSMDTGNIAGVKALLEKHEIHYPIGILTADSLKKAGKTLDGLPVTLIVDANGTIREILLAKTSRDEVLNAMARVHQLRPSG